ncbi:hypothetical protein BDR06DRAFT_972196 [Suillus hirtellus]|nr:hypothetical protein BDR06DRAFT_972196 [Suillus hirtellus]
MTSMMKGRVGAATQLDLWCQDILAGCMTQYKCIISLLFGSVNVHVQSPCMLVMEKDDMGGASSLASALSTLSLAAVPPHSSSSVTLVQVVEVRSSLTKPPSASNTPGTPSIMEETVSEWVLVQQVQALLHLHGTATWTHLATDGASAMSCS